MRSMLLISQQRGVGLLVVLLMLSVWSLLVLLTMENTILQRKQHQYYVEYSQLRSTSHEAMQQLLQRFRLNHSQSLLYDYSHCFVKEVPMPEMINLATLQSLGCGWQTSHTDIGFILKLLYSDICSQLVTEHLSGTDFYQLTLYAGTRNDRARYQVQTSFAILHWPHVTCLSSMIRPVSSGALSFRPLLA